MRLDDLRPASSAARISLTATSKLPSRFGVYVLHVFQDHQAGVEHIALVLGEIENSSNVLARVHSECLTGDIFSSQRCDCGEQLEAAQSLIYTAQQGVIIYLRGHEGRGIGITNKILAYGLQDQGLDTVEANLELNLPVDSRRYDAAAEILKMLKVRSIRLLTNNPDKVSALLSSKILIDSIQPIQTSPNAFNHAYLQTKQLKLGHTLSL